MENEKRIKPVDKLVIHMSRGPDLRDKDAREVQDIFSEYGRGWGYANYAKAKSIKVDEIVTGHLHPACNGQQTFSQAHYALVPSTYSETGYKIVALVYDPFNVVCWHTDNWIDKATKEFHIGPINQESIGLEVCGYGRALPEGGLITIVNGFKQHARNLLLIGSSFAISGHCDHVKTDCPGEIYKQLPDLRAMFDKVLAK